MLDISHVSSIEKKNIVTIKSIAICSHSPYLLHKFAIDYFFDYSVCFIRVTDCSITVAILKVGNTITRGSSPLAPLGYAYAYILFFIVD